MVVPVAAAVLMVWATLPNDSTRGPTNTHSVVTVFFFLIIIVIVTRSSRGGGSGDE